MEEVRFDWPARGPTPTCDGKTNVVRQDKVKLSPSLGRVIFLCDVRQGIRFGVFNTWSIRQDKVEMTKEEGPPGLAGV